MSQAMDVFQIHREVIADYKAYVKSFIRIHDPHISKFVDQEMEKGKFWPEPLVQFNPAFESGESVASLCDLGTT